MHPYEVFEAADPDGKDGLSVRRAAPVYLRSRRPANKHLVREAVETVFNVTVEAVRIINIHGKQRRFGRHMGQTPAGRRRS
jgi:large subunit ribosomal protein L23